MIRIISKITSSEVNDPYLRLCAGILKRAVVDARGGDAGALLFLETDFARWMAGAIEIERDLARFCDDKRSKNNKNKRKWIARWR
jgi:hypothetical protein